MCYGSHSIIGGDSGQVSFLVTVNSVIDFVPLLHYLLWLSLIDTFKRLIGRVKSPKCRFTSHMSSFAHRH